jgi:outer membrane protein TolC
LASASQPPKASDHSEQSPKTSEAQRGDSSNRTPSRIETNQKPAGDPNRVDTDKQATTAPIRGAATTAPTSRRKMSLLEVLKELLLQNPLLARERLVIRQAQASLQIARGAFGLDLDLNLQFNEHNLSGGYQSYSSGDSVLAELFRQSWQVQSYVQLSKKFELGTNVSLRLEQIWLSQNNVYDFLDQTKQQQQTWNESLTPVLSLSLKQPLLRGAWLSVNLAPIWQAEEQTRMANTQVNLLASQYVAQVIYLYWDLYYLYRKLAIQRSNLDLAQQQLRDTQTLIQTGKISPLEEYQVQQVVASRQADILSTQDQIQELQSRLSTFLYSQRLLQIIPSDRPQQLHDLPTSTDFLVWSREQNFELAVAQHQLKIANWSTLIAKNNTLPRLDLQTGFAFAGAGHLSSRVPQITDSPFGRGYATLFDPRTHSFYIGLQLQIPLDNRQLRYALERSQLDSQRIEYLIEHLRIQLRDQINQLHSKALRHRKSIPITEVSEQWARKKLEAEQTKYGLGRSTIFNILQYQQDLAVAQIAVIATYVEYQKTVTALYERSGTLLKRYDIATIAEK